MGTRIHRNVKFGRDVHNYLKNQEMSCILIFLVFYAN